MGYLRGRSELEVFYNWCCICWERVQSEILLCYLSVCDMIKIFCDLGSEKSYKLNKTRQDKDEWVVVSSHGSVSQHSP